MSSVSLHPEVWGATASSFWLSAAIRPLFMADGNTLFPLCDDVQGAEAIFLPSAVVGPLPWPVTSSN